MFFLQIFVKNSAQVGSNWQCCVSCILQDIHCPLGDCWELLIWLKCESLWANRVGIRAARPVMSRGNRRRRISAEPREWDLMAWGIEGHLSLEVFAPGLPLYQILEESQAASSLSSCMGVRFIFILFVHLAIFGAGMPSGSLRLSIPWSCR